MVTSIRWIFFFFFIGVGALHAQLFVDRTVASGIAGTSLGPAPGAQPFRGSAWADFDGDGRQDLLATTGANTLGVPAVVLLRGQANGTFVQSATVSASAGDAYGDVISADIDNDGDEDAYVCVAPFPYANGGMLLVNDGGGNFTEESAIRNVALYGGTNCASFGDYDRDGWIDLALGRALSPSSPAAVQLFRNLGAGVFLNTTAIAGLVVGDAASVTFVDFDGDQWPDIFAPTVGTALWRNGRNGTFADVGVSVNAQPGVVGYGAATADIGDDGDIDILTLDPSGAGQILLEYDGAARVFNLGGDYAAVATSYGLNPSPSFAGLAARFADFDNDGYSDVAMGATYPSAPRLFRGSASSLPFVDASSAVAFPILGAAGISTCDFDDDGRMDIFFPHAYVTPQGGSSSYFGAALLQNSTPAGQHWIKIRLIGSSSNRSAIGSVVIARSGALTQRRQLVSADGFRGDGDHRLHFGLGANTVVNELEIRWPSGTVQYVANLAVDQILTITEPGFQFAGSMTPGSTNAIAAVFPYDAGATYFAALVAAPSSELYLPDARAIRVDVNDPLIALSTSFGNPYFGGYAGVVLGPAVMSLNLPPVAALTGLQAYVVAVTLDATYAGGVKSILGPERFTIN